MGDGFERWEINEEAFFKLVEEGFNTYFWVHPLLVEKDDTTNAVLTRSPGKETEYKKLTITIPEEWLWKLTKRNVPPQGKQDYIYHMSRIGFEANKSKLKKIVDNYTVKEPPRNSRSRGWGGWDRFEKEAERFFASIEKTCKREADDITVKAKLLQEIVDGSPS